MKDCLSLWFLFTLNFRQLFSKGRLSSEYANAITQPCHVRNVSTPLHLQWIRKDQVTESKPKAKRIRTPQPKPFLKSTHFIWCNQRAMYFKKTYTIPFLWADCLLHLATLWCTRCQETKCLEQQLNYVSKLKFLRWSRSFQGKGSSIYVQEKFLKLSD